MKGSMRAATALGVGYLLGRRKSLRTATLMAVATAVGSSDVGSMVLRRGMKMLGSTDVLGKLAPQLGDIADTVRGDLLTAGKAAATAALTNQVDSLTDSLHERAARVRNPGEAAGEAAGAAGAATGKASSGGRRAAGAASGAARRGTGRGRSAARDEDDYEADDVEAADEDDYDTDEPDPRDDADDYQADEPIDDDADTEAGEPDGPRRARRGTARRRSPVSRAGR